jgi:Tol biopolymer transport system component
MLILFISTIARFGVLPAIQHMSCEEGAIALWDRSQGNHIPLVEAGQCVTSVVWSPDGEQIAFARHTAMSTTNGISLPQLLIASMNGEPTRIVHNGHERFQLRGTIYETRIQWSPDGQWLLYVIRPGWSDLKMWVVRADGTAIYEYTDFIEFEPAVFFWSGDSQHIYIRMVEFDSQARAIHLIKVPVSANPEPLVIEPVLFEDSVWVYPSVRGGEMVTFTRDGLWLVNLDNGTSQFIADTDQRAYIGSVDARWSSDSEWLALLGATHDAGMLLQIVRLDGSARREITIAADSDDNRNWLLTDFDWPHTVRIVSPDWSGLICTIDLNDETYDCAIGYDARRFVIQPSY